MGSNSALSGIDPYRGRGGVPTSYGSEYKTLLVDGNIKFVTTSNLTDAVRTPDATRAPNRVYVTITRKGKVQAITTYDSQGRKDAQIDIWHSHDGLKPHAHDRDDHTRGRPLSQQEELLLKYALKKWSEHGQRV